ncbi:carbon-nitrogen family hydrolase [Kineosporia sp. J2-2]|uniref:Carbon-nitrogen family hydrolase n=1 Tax=Kineosporia corallincola TaxID=2835133 RepID=A0ABS5TKH1_9ACTN|nr:carbon-nitrogen family hydrolase [Kineosporia corallincola]MBT0771338.1 carbon-nitrogen family hydrolase [Kineosporia corallincola]
MRVHVLQLAYGDDEPVAERVRRAEALVAAQSGADLVVLPELWAPTGFGYRRWPGAAEPLDGPTVTAIARAARHIGAYVHAGSIIEAAAPHADRGPDGRGLWNTSVLIARDGTPLVSYRKVHRFGFAAGEPDLIEAGTELVTVPLRAGGHTVTAGLATCYDLRFPELFRGLTQAGAGLFVVPAAWPAARVEHWRLLGRARAVENQAVVVQCNTAGTHAGTRMGGHSQVVSATGEVLAEAGDDETVLVADVDLAGIGTYREQFPVLADRRL